MKLSLTENKKIMTFLSLCNLLKKSNSVIKMVFSETHLYIQGMDKCNICLHEIKIFSNWFNLYSLNTSNKDEVINVDIVKLSLILSLYKEGNELILSYDENEENSEEELVIIFGKDETNKQFVIPLINLDSDFMSIPESIYEVQITLQSKKIFDLTNQLLLFGDNLNIECFDEKICFNTTGDNGKMTSYIKYDDMFGFDINIENNIVATYSLNILNKLCLTSNLSEYVSIYVSDNIPMKIKYELDLPYENNNEKSYVEFYIAPKIND